jgi:hypothetical protein
VPGTGDKTKFVILLHSCTSDPHLTDCRTPQPSPPSRPPTQRRHYAWYMTCRVRMSSLGRWPRSPVRCLVRVGQRLAGGWMAPCCKTAPRAPSLCVRGPFTLLHSQAWGWLTQAPSPSARGLWSPQPSCWSKVLANGDISTLVLLPLLCLHASCRFLGSKGVPGTGPQGHILGIVLCLPLPVTS